jgi:hypothetical protein
MPTSRATEKGTERKIQDSSDACQLNNPNHHARPIGIAATPSCGGSARWGHGASQPRHVPEPPLAWLTGARGVAMGRFAEGGQTAEPARAANRRTADHARCRPRSPPRARAALAAQCRARTPLSSRVTGRREPGAAGTGGSWTGRTCSLPIAWPGPGDPALRAGRATSARAAVRAHCVQPYSRSHAAAHRQSMRGRRRPPARSRRAPARTHPGTRAASGSPCRLDSHAVAVMANVPEPVSGSCWRDVRHQPGTGAIEVPVGPVCFFFSYVLINSSLSVLVVVTIESAP